MRKLNYLKVMVIVHGKSEYQLARFIKSNLKIKMEIIAEKRGRNSIQITSVMKKLNDMIFKTRKSFLNKYDDIEVKNKKLLNFKLFIIMDVDDCTKEQRKKYISKKMFKNHWLYDYIIPIYNDKNFEDVMEKCNIKITKKNDYIQIFPVNHSEKDFDQICKFNEILKQNQEITNLSEFISYCLNIAKN